MNFIVKSIIVLSLTACSIAGCSGSPEIPEEQDQGNYADEQRSRAQQAQDELSSETSGE